MVKDCSGQYYVCMCVEANELSRQWQRSHMYAYMDDSSLEGGVWLWSVMGTLDMHERKRKGEREKESTPLCPLIQQLTYEIDAIC